MRVNVYFRTEFYKKIKLKCKAANMNMSEYIRYALLKLWEV